MIRFPIKLPRDSLDNRPSAQTQPAVIATTEMRRDGRTDEIVLEEFFDTSGRVAAEHAVGLEEENVLCWGELSPEPKGNRGLEAGFFWKRK